ncbi:hypothetical protein BSZ36_05255 [Rubricoccus marinus]|uniref:Fibronectin type-III domain-containing protein n=2 Tax=Rubricoccus marinus TaxID=716817 RepID=A0A259TXL8_9BACT|nr:hypothetical protein BSZ36_05255 [Rubricoccus marinus]
MGAALDASAATFAWESVPGAMARLQVSDSPGFANPILDIDAGPVSEITLTDALEPTQEARFWRVGAVEASGETAWSRPRPFSLPPPEALPGVRSQAEKTQQAASRAARADRKAARGSTVVPELPPPPPLPPLPTGATISGDPSATDWRRVPGVRVHDHEEAASGEEPRVLGPLGGAIADGAAVTFRWTGVPGARTYEIEVGPDLSGPTLRMGGITTTELALNGVLPSVGDRLFWRVRAEEASGARGPWSKYGRFYAGTDLQAIAYHDRQESERAYARRVQDHAALQKTADLDLVAPHQRPIDSEAETMGYAFFIAMLSAGILMLLIVAIGGMVAW